MPETGSKRVTVKLDELSAYSLAVQLYKPAGGVASISDMVLKACKKPGKAKVRDRAWFVRLYGEIIPTYSEGVIDHTDAQTMLYLTCTMISSIDLAHYRVSIGKDWASVACGTTFNTD